MKFYIAIVLVFLMVQPIFANNQDSVFPKKLLKEIERSFNIQYPEFEEIKELNKVIDSVHNRGKFYKLKNYPDTLYVYLGKVNTCRSSGCSIGNIHSPDEGFEFFHYYILFDSNSKILRVRIYESEMTHGNEITVPEWLNQFAGFDGSSSLEIDKDIDAISGATTSVNGIISDINEKTILLRNILLRGNSSK